MTSSASDAILELDTTRGFDASVETAISTVLMAGDRVWKLRKPVALPYLDQRSLDAQRRLCEREVELNARLAPDVYLGVVEIDDPAGGGRRPATLMRRMPEARRLSALIAAGVDVRREIREIAHVIASFHLSAACGTSIARAGSPAALSRRWHDCLAVLDRHDDILDRAAVIAVRRLADSYIAGRGALLQRRIAADKIVDGHGDLLADDIFCLESGPRILDCLEFDDALRCCDTVSDVASLAMDCERLGAPELGELLLAEYASFTADSYPASLAHHYIAYRAVVRCEVACLRHEQGDPMAAATAGRLLDIALRHARLARPTLVLVGGPPGVGKSTVAASLADALEWTVIRSDEIRREVIGGEAWAGSSEWLSARFSAAATETTYEAMLSRAGTLLGLGESVILDATWSSAANREAARRTAELSCGGFVALHCVVRPRVAERRVGRRIAAGADISMATVAVARQIAAAFDPWPESVTLDTGVTVAETLVAAMDAIRAAGAEECAPPRRKEAHP